MGPSRSVRSEFGPNASPQPLQCGRNSNVLYESSRISSRLLRLTHGEHSNWERERIKKELIAIPGEHLVDSPLFADALTTSPTSGYDNDADIDRAKIVWAREIPKLDTLRPLLDYYKNRKVWLV